MPSPYRGERPYPGKEWTLRHAAEDGQIIICTCGTCRREVRYLAADLLPFFHPAGTPLNRPSPAPAAAAPAWCG